MADSLGTNPIVIDLTNATDRTILTGRMHVANIVISGDDDTNDAIISIRQGSATGVKQFQFMSDTSVTPINQESFHANAPFTDPFFNNDEGTAWAAGAVMLIYLK